MSAPRRIVVAFSGGLDTSYCVAWLKHTTGAEVVAVTVDTGGFDAAELAAVRARAAECGADRVLVVDGRQHAFDRVVTLLVRANVLRGGVYPLCVSAERLSQAELLARTALELGADAVAHGSTGAGNDQVRFDVALRTLAPGLAVLTPIRDQGLSREDETAWLVGRGIAVPDEVRTYSVNRGLWGTTIGGGAIHDPWRTVPEAAYPTVVAPATAPAAGAEVVLGFEHGIPVALDGRTLPGPELVAELAATAAAHGIGRGVHLGDTILGIKGRIAFEAPAAAVLLPAHRELEKLVLTRWQRFWNDQLSEFVGLVVHEALPQDPVLDDLAAWFASSQRRVTGEVRLALGRGVVTVEGVRSPHSLVAVADATYGETQALWDARDAAGFCRLYGLQGRLAHAARPGGGT